MRMILALPLLMVAGCDVDRDAANDQTTFSIDEQKIENAADRVGNAAEEVASGVGNVAEDVGHSVKNEVGDVDVDVDVSRNKQ